MSQGDRKWWLVRLKAGKTIANHLINVDSIDKFKSELPKAVQLIYYGQASWQTMNHLTGCVIPDKMRMHNYADGPLFFERNQQEVLLHA